MKYSLYLVTDRHYLPPEKTLADAVEEAILGGCTMIQLREKNEQGRAFYEQAVEIKRVTDRHRIPLIINDRIDIALAVDADGVHLGQADIPAAAARRLIGDRRILGISVTSVEEAGTAIDAGADYLGIGAVYPTETKKDAVIVSAEELLCIRKCCPLPLVAIGGITKENAGNLHEMGLDGVAVISAILSQSDIRAAAAAVKIAFDQGCSKGKI